MVTRYEVSDMSVAGIEGLISTLLLLRRGKWGKERH